MFRQLPARPGVHIGQQTEQEHARLPARLHPTEPARDRGEPGVELSQPLPDGYAVPSGPSHGLRLSRQVIDDHPTAVSMPSGTPTSPSATSPSSGIYITNLGWGARPHAEEIR
ncbi:hypothetical protein ACFO1B_39680 [Dactylosporangium siamense]|uniref:hypothetical protein n=1 Tax=Dactylosporangium siamense TaxID=685454 RepID=UPI001EF1AEC6|nr:hypothetical protein [Dactylosporangium siamense]